MFQWGIHALVKFEFTGYSEEFILSLNFLQLREFKIFLHIDKLEMMFSPAL
jgi:hypothetical protein